MGQELECAGLPVSFCKGWRNDSVLVDGVEFSREESADDGGKVGVSGAMSSSGGNERGSNYSPAWKPQPGAWALRPQEQRRWGDSVCGQRFREEGGSVERSKFQCLPHGIFVRIA